MQKTVRKYLALLVVTTGAIVGILAAGSAAGAPSCVVETVALKTQDVERTVLCAGTVETAHSQAVYTDITCVAGEVLVEAGQSVRKGDVLFTVDQEATRQVLATAGGLSPDDLPDLEVGGEITAPVNGVVTTLNVSQGQPTDSKKPCAVISSSDELQVRVAIHEKYIKRVAVGQTATISGTAFLKPAYHGTVTYISPSARQQYVGSTSETVVDAIITLDPEENDASLRLGLSAKARVTVGLSEDALVVPYECVGQGADDQEYVYVYEDGRAVKRVITTGDELSDGFQVIEGLRPGDRVITTPESITRDGETVALRDA